MNRVTLAYEVLGDEDKRILYDTGGLESVKEGVEDLPAMRDKAVASLLTSDMLRHRTPEQRVRGVLGNGLH